MKEHPILFSTEMVKAILDGRKTMTRRIIKPQLEDYRDGYPDGYDSPPQCMVKYKGKWIDDGDFIADYCPYGQVGSKLWVGETWACSPATGLIPQFIYYADNPNAKQSDGKWHSSIFMPRFASRITLEITGIRVERVQEITPDDAVAEGFGALTWDCMHSAIDNFRNYWDKLNAKHGYSWESNCWVWIIEFKESK